MSDPGGEALAVLCKATGLPRTALRQLWRALRRPETTEAGELAPGLSRAVMIYDMVAVDRAQTVFAVLELVALFSDDADTGKGHPRRRRHGVG